GQFPDVGTGSAADTVPAFGTQDHVLQHGEVVGEHEVLVHHADTVLDGLRGRVETYLLAADEDVALVRPVHAVQGLHQRGLARAVHAIVGENGAGATLMSMSWLATTPGKRLVIPRSST